ncbi:methyltransferase domain-containing protein [Dyella solisilvae]|nr:methyltransferase domain-containing protein [Dyella solisilvae]
MTDPLHTLIRELEQDHTLEQPERLRERVHALDRLEDLLLHVSDARACDGPLRQRAQALHARLSTVQQRLCEAIRQAIKQGAGSQVLHGWTTPGQSPVADGYDHLDALVSDVLAFEEPTDDIASLDADMVFYQPTPARHVLDLIDRAAISDRDVLVDLGSGLGHVPLLVSICTGAHCIGIERETAYVEGARRSAASLQLDQVRFMAQDAREADLSRGNLFYLYTPFTGGILRQVLDRLKQEASHREIRLATFGPCTDIVAAEPWLVPSCQPGSDRITVFKACNA